MKMLFEIKDGTVVNSASDAANILFYATPDDAEKQQLIETLHIDRHTLESALDPDEISRVELTPSYIGIIWKCPKNISFEQQLKFEVSSVGLFLQGNKLIVVSGENKVPFEGKEFQKVRSLTDVVLKFFLHTIRHYFEHLKVIRLINKELQTKLISSMENRYLLQMFTLDESLIYYINALESNASVLLRMRANADRLSLPKEEIDMPDDIIIEHEQCYKQTQIYSTVLSGLMDARGTIINNNMNVLLKKLTLINVVFLPLNLIASIGGMSEFSALTEGIPWWISYSLFTLAMIIFGWLTWVFLVKRIDRVTVSNEEGR